MTIAVDAVTSQAIAYPTLDDANSIAHTCAGSDRYMLVAFLMGYNDQAYTFSSAPAYNSVAMSQIANITDGGPAQSRIYVYELVAPDTGANNLTFQFSGAGQGNNRTGLVIASFTGVDQSTPTGTVVTNSGSSTPFSLDVSSATGELVVDFLHQYYTGTFTVGAGQTELFANFNPASTGTFGASYGAGASTTTMSWTGGGGEDWTQVGVPIKPAAAAPYVPPVQEYLKVLFRAP